MLTPLRTGSHSKNVPGGSPSKRRSAMIQEKAPLRDNWMLNFTDTSKHIFPYCIVQKYVLTHAPVPVYDLRNNFNPESAEDWRTFTHRNYPYYQFDDEDHREIPQGTWVYVVYSANSYVRNIKATGANADQQTADTGRGINDTICLAFNILMVGVVQDV